MKNLHVTIQIRNNQIYRRRMDLGLTQIQIAKAIGITTYEFQKLETCIRSPVDKTGNWTDYAIKLSNFFCEEPEVIFSEDVLSIEKNKIVTEVNKNTLLMQSQEKLLLESGISQLEKVEFSETTRKALANLTKREEKVLRMRFGIGEESDYTHEEIGVELNVGHSRTRQIQNKALRKLRHPDVANKLKDFKE